MPGQSAHELTRRRVPHFNSAIARCGHYIAIVEIDHIDRGAVAHQSPLDLDVFGRVHVPHNNLPVFRAGDHNAVHEAQVEHGFFVVVQGLHVLARLYVPYADSGVARAANDYVLVVLEAEYAAGVSAQGFDAFGFLLVPHFDRVVSQAAYYFVIVVL